MVRDAYEDLGTAEKEVLAAEGELRRDAEKRVVKYGHQRNVAASWQADYIHSQVSSWIDIVLFADHT